MIISSIAAGIGNQLFQYAAGRRLAHKLNTDFKLDIDPFLLGRTTHPFYALDQFNISATVATPEEIARVKQISAQRGLGIENVEQKFMPEVLDYPDDVYLEGDWIDQRYFADIADIIRKEFTLKELSPSALYWRKKILSEKCSVSMHLRHGDFLYHPVRYNESWRIVTLDYYRDCLETLKLYYKNLSVFVFSDNMPYVKENLRFDVPTEYVSGSGVGDAEEIYLMSLCKHNILSRGSTFSRWAAWLNQNPDKKVFVSIPSSTEKVLWYRNNWTPIETPRATGVMLGVPSDKKNRPDVTMRPWYSLLMVVSDNAVDLPETLGTILSQDYKFYEVIIVDNCSTDGSRQICRQAVKQFDKVTMIRLYNKVSNGAAWNKALGVAQGDYVMFLTGKDKLLSNALSAVYPPNETVLVDVINSAAWLREDDHGDISAAGKNFAIETDACFGDLKEIFRGKFDKPTVLKILSANANAVPLATKFFKRQFLTDNAIRFNETLPDNDAEVMFMTETMMRTDAETLILPDPFYVAPRR